VDGQIVKLHPHAFVVVTASGRGVLCIWGSTPFSSRARVTRWRRAPHLSRGTRARVEAGGRSPVSPVIALDAPPEAIGDTVTTGQVEAGAKLFVWQ
jgi:sugar PTS system EIIA component